MQYLKKVPNASMSYPHIQFIVLKIVYTVMTLYVIIWDSQWRENEMSKYGHRRHRMTKTMSSAVFETGGPTKKILTSTTEVF